tara:strand:+ start:180 stop:347 length:168 start_codon:yes stop_codon:yes gene_type:complete
MACKNKESTVRQEYCSDEEHSVEGDLISWLGSNVGFDYIRQFLLASGYEINKIGK